MGSMKGFTLIEILLAVLGSAGMMYLVADLIVGSEMHMNRAVAQRTLVDLKITTFATVQDDQAWANTIADPANASSLSCILSSPTNVCNTSTASACTSSSGGLLQWRNAANEIVVNSSPASGFSFSGAPCSSFDSASGNNSCPLRMEIRWRPLCNGGVCTKVEISGSPVANAESKLLSNWNPALYSFKAYRDMPPQSPLGTPWSAANLAGQPSVQRSGASTSQLGAGKVFVWGGYDGMSTLTDGAIYDIGTNSWSPLPIAGAPPFTMFAGGYYTMWTGSRVFMYSGNAGNDMQGFYDPASNSWQGMGPSSSPHAVNIGIANAWINGKAYLWGGFQGSYSSEGNVYDEATNSWSALPASPLSARFGASGNKFGDKFFVWGGQAGGDGLVDGAVFDPVANSWTSIANPGPVEVPNYFSGFYRCSAFDEAGGKLYVFGDYETPTMPQDSRVRSAVYNASSDTWSQIPVAPIPNEPNLLWRILVGIPNCSFDNGVFYVWQPGLTYCWPLRVAIGIKYTVSSGTWKLISGNGAEYRLNPDVLFHGGRLIEVGGDQSADASTTAARVYNPALDP